MPIVPVVTFTEAAAMFEVSVNTIKQWVYLGDLKAFKIKGTHYIAQDEVSRFYFNKYHKDKP
jgi:predicted site-specific integrase-resolvase